MSHDSIFRFPLSPDSVQIFIKLYENVARYSLGREPSAVYMSKWVKNIFRSCKKFIRMNTPTHRPVVDRNRDGS